MNGILLDTSFLISFSDPNRPHHETAKQYYRKSLEREIPLFLSSIVIAEFEVKQPITDLPLRNMLVLPFNVDHARACGLMTGLINRSKTDDRVRVKDDLKLIAQCACEGISHLLTEDSNTLVKYMQSSNQPTKPILLKHGFDLSHFDGGQYSISM
jgi:predicted nucleic acid-binding protein